MDRRERLRARGFLSLTLSGSIAMASTTEGLLRCLMGTMNQDAAVRHQSEVQLAQLSLQHGFGLALLEVGEK